MKKISLIVVLLIVVSMLCACGDGVAQTPNTTAPQAEKDEGPVGYTFTYDDVKMGVGMDGTKVLEALGEAKSRVVSASCAFGGNDIQYDYMSVKITTNDENGYEQIYLIQLVDDMAHTEKGIKIGSSSDAITAAYGDPTTTNAGGFIYEKDGMELRFLLKDGTVTSIQYMLKSAA